MTYLIWNKKTITDFSDENFSSLYNNGYLFGRTGKGEMYQTRSLRVNLEKFILSSENKRILKKTENIEIDIAPIPYTYYHWSIHKMGKDFYQKKFGNKTFSANKIKELMTDNKQSNFNLIMKFNRSLREVTKERRSYPAELRLPYDNEISTLPSVARNDVLGFCIAYQTKEFLHYCYPFYDLANSPKDMGLGMMTRAV